MKILFVASNPVAYRRVAELQASAGAAAIGGQPDEYSSLELEREITALQQRLLFEAQSGQVDLRILPQLSVHDLARAIDKYQPDILHVSAHGSKDSIVLSNVDERPRRLHVNQFIDILDGVEKKPRLIFVSACTSSDIAKRLVSAVEFSIGTVGSISVPAAREAAVKFYELLAKGYCVERAFVAARATVRIEDVGIDLTRYEQQLGAAAKTTLAEPLRLLAAFSEVERLKSDEENVKRIDLNEDAGELEIELGIAGCPEDIRQVVLFLDVDTEDIEDGHRC